MKIIFLDVDGVLNCEYTHTKGMSLFPIDPYMVLLVDRIVQATGAKVVLSSSWRYHPESAAIVKKSVDFIDVTPMNRGTSSRGTEIKAWLDAHPDVTKYAILDDNTDMLTAQMPSFFKTDWDKGLTDEVANKVIAHLL